jgi:lysophospholipase L1-like esterase
MRRCRLLLLLCALRLPAGAEPFRDGDRVCLVGDSITSGGAYHAAVQLFYATRYPTRRITWFNCGHSGGSAGECLTRLEWDVLAHRPTAATVSFGMNDMAGVYAEPVEENIAKRIAGVERNYTTLLDKLGAAGVRLTLVGPSPYDDTVQVATKIERSNLAMTRWTQRLARLAADRGYGCVDLGAVMNPINAVLQAADPKATLIGNDRVHPGPVGHAVMAYALLKAQGVEPVVARVTVDGASGQVGKLAGCTVEQVERGAAGLSFTVTAQALPFVLPPAAQKALDLVPLTGELNREVLTVTSLPPGTYALSVDGTAVGSYAATGLATGVNLAANAQTPQYQQALALAKLNEQRNALESGHVRCRAFIRHSLLTKAKVDPTDEAAVQAFLQARIAGKAQADFRYDDFMARRYLQEVAPRWDETVKQLAELTAQMTTDRQPKPHRFVLTRAR